MQIGQEIVLTLANEELQFSAEKIVFWEKEKTLFLADCHFGKVAHFRKSGIGIPAAAGNETFHSLHQIILKWKPQRVVFLGDLFHSQFNLDFERFALWKSNFPKIQFDLVIGNHDVSSGKHLFELGLAIHPHLIIGPFHCTHHPEFNSALGFNFSGHIHPSVRISGTAMQSATCPCFWIGERFLVFPSFGQFTGSSKIKAGSEEVVLAIAGKKLIRIEGHLLRI